MHEYPVAFWTSEEELRFERELQNDVISAAAAAETGGVSGAPLAAIEDEMDMFSSPAGSLSDLSHLPPPTPSSSSTSATNTKGELCEVNTKDPPMVFHSNFLRHCATFFGFFWIAPKSLPFVCFDILLHNRPISLLSSLSKVFEKVLYKRMVKFFNKNNLFTPAQYGFRPKYSCANAIAEITDFIRDEIDKKTLNFAALSIEFGIFIQ